MLVPLYASTYPHNHRVGTEQQPLLTGLAAAGSTALGRVLDDVWVASAPLWTSTQ